jgi:hypothetical protein
MQDCLQARFKNQLREFIVDFECLLHSRVVQVGVRSVDYLYRCRLLHCGTIYLHSRRPAAELVPVLLQENGF